MAQGIMITRCCSRVSNDPREDWPVGTSLFETLEECESRRSIPRANRPSPELGSETGGRRKRL
jgi:hypothetical protein